MGDKRSEKAVQNEALVAVSQLPKTMAWRNNTGMAWQGTQRPLKIGQPLVVQRGMVVLFDARPITFGLPGSGDLLGVSDERAFAIEMKALGGKQREQQLKFQRAFEAAGGLYGIAHSAEEALELLTGAGG